MNLTFDRCHGPCKPVRSMKAAGWPDQNLAGAVGGFAGKQLCDVLDRLLLAVACDYVSTVLQAEGPARRCQWGRAVTCSDLWAVPARRSMNLGGELHLQSARRSEGCVRAAIPPGPHDRLPGCFIR